MVLKTPGAFSGQIPSLDPILHLIDDPKKREQQEFENYKRAAEQNDTKAAYNLAICYQRGEGVSEDPNLAFQWFKKAADLGLPEAQLAAGICYYNELGTPQNYVEALRLLKPLAEQGNRHAQYFLGDYYYYETKDYYQAAKWYAAAAEQKYVPALNNLGICYENGQGLQQSNEKAFHCYQQAAAQFLPLALINEGRCYAEGRGISPNKQVALTLHQQAEILGGAKALYRIKVTVLQSQVNGESSASPAC